MQGNRNLPTLVALTPILALVFLFYIILSFDKVNAQEVQDKPKYTTNTYYLMSEMTEPEDIIDFYETAYRDQIDRTLDWINRYRDLKERCGI